MCDCTNLCSRLDRDLINSILNTYYDDEHKEYRRVLDVKKTIPEDRLDSVDDGLLRILIQGIKKDITIHRAHIQNKLDRIGGKHMFKNTQIDLQLSWEIVDKCKKTLRSIPQDMMHELDICMEDICDEHYLILEATLPYKL